MEKASLFWRLTSTYWWALATMYFCNCVAPLILFWKKARTSPFWLYVVSVLVLIGMWFERFNIIVPSLGHDFYPYTWGIYIPTLTDSTIIVGSFAWFFILFLGFIKLMPSLSVVEVKETLAPPMRDLAHGHRHH
jgi:molybdopterin-containing oxidoreductase family membrane subunit